MNAWIQAIRLRTLPLAIANISMGSVLAAFLHGFSWVIYGLAVLTAIFLQILSNLANDYGDSFHGVDGKERSGPERAIQSGVISSSSMRKAIGFSIFLSLASGLVLIFVSFHSPVLILIFALLGILSIWAAIRYTAGDHPYGYRGLGDAAVFLFFGLVAVGGSYFLQTGTLDTTILLPAASCGLFSIGVLNVNNIRDIESDRAAGKISIPVRIGREKAIVYHAWVLGLGLFFGIAFSIIHFHSYWQFLFLIITPLLLKNILAVIRISDPMKLDPYLKQMAMTNLMFVLTFAVGLFI